MTGIINSPQILKQSPDRLILSVSSSVDVLTYFLGGAVLTGIAIALFVGGDSVPTLVWGVMAATLAVLSWLGMFSTLSSRTTTLYKFDTQTQQLRVKQTGMGYESVKAYQAYPLNHCRLQTRQRQTGSLGSVYTVLQLCIQPPRQPSVTFEFDYNSDADLHEMEAILRSYLPADERE
ncbi:MAG: hypothetical protein ACPGVO_15975 [Spirulinaceae cyanobacterium]